MKDAGGHGSNGRGGAQGKMRGMPIAGHPYHLKSDAELRFIAKDAHAAAQAQRGMSSEGKYLDQVNDASTVLGWRQRGGRDLSQQPSKLAHQEPGSELFKSESQAAQGDDDSGWRKAGATWKDTFGYDMPKGG